MPEKHLLSLDIDLTSDKYNDPFVRNEETLSVEELIPRILAERKSFADLTEESIIKEINAANDAESELNASQVATEAFQGPSKEASESLDNLSDESSLETIQKKKIELANCIHSAINETSLSLDFVSLLISGIKPNAGKSTISPHLAANIPLGSLNSDRLAGVESSAAETPAAVGQGWKLDSLKRITNLFEDASNILEKQTKKEQNYWNMIHIVLQNNEALCKLKDPINGSNAIGVRYGFGDSGSSYHDKGLAVLRKNDVDGNISFHPVSDNNKHVNKVFKYVKVKILSEIDDDYMVTGQSSFSQDFLKEGKHEIINEIEKARYFIFEEDLFYFLTREAKVLVNYNVNLIGNKIIIDLNKELIEIEALPYDELNEDELDNYYQNVNKDSCINNDKAQSILVFLKLMLCCFYEYNLKLKQRVPTAVTKWKQNNSHPLILRPLLGHIRHEINLKFTNDLLAEITDKYGKDIKTDYKSSRYTKLREMSKVSNPFMKSVERPHSTYDVIIENKSNNKVLKIPIEITSTEYYCDLVIKLSVVKYEKEEDSHNNTDGVNLLQITFSEFSEFSECLHWTIRNFINKS
ncbi:Piso0_005308 [Millerozyma farinosa CBS 7064]|uniref:Mediator of RNA polymerase II transcription subunit 17 n=1 Tax=Pichia sorbitophila (strain ATCC MYA-4447 / BCRC 22081 / CBS 7064 / NBRC 10061 / NRRL Y-12695) TaxID=559304 RepID=G8Y1U2_PICSO|nr:Piso0_005308 [Millerozyma farinosa CBS 7064]